MSLTREQKVAIGLVLFSVIYLVASWRLPRFSLGTTVVDSFIFPMVIGFTLLFLSVLYFFTARKADQAKADKPLFDGADKMVVLKLVAATFAYAFVLEFLGFIIATTLFLCGCMWMLGTRGWVKLGVTPVAFSFIVYFAFVQILNVPLARGLMPF